MTTTEQHRFLTIQEAADLLRVHPKTAHRYVQAGRPPATRVGGVWLIDREELDRLLAASGGRRIP